MLNTHINNGVLYFKQWLICYTSYKYEHKYDNAHIMIMPKWIINFNILLFRNSNFSKEFLH